MKNDGMTVGVISGTPFDTKLGVTNVKKLGINAISYCLSTNPTEQTSLQKNKILLLQKVNLAINSLINAGANCILIYCNSMSLSINLDILRKKYDVKIISTVDIVKNIKLSSSRVGLLSANCHTVSNMESLLLRGNPKCSIIGLAFLPLVNTIELGTAPKKIIEQHGLIELLKFFAANNCGELILGCTHFEIIYPDLADLLLKENIPLQLIPAFGLSSKILQKDTSSQQQIINPVLSSAKPFVGEAYSQQHHR